MDNRNQWVPYAPGELEGVVGVSAQREICRALAKIRVAQEILAGLGAVSDETITDLIRSRAEALGNRITDTELEVMTEYIDGQSPESIAEERGLSTRTISNQLRTGSQKLGFKDRRELKGWGTAVRGFNIGQQPEE